MEPQSAPGDDPAGLLPIPDWMKARARVVSTQNVTWQKPAVYHSSATHPLRQSLSSATVKPPAKLTPLPLDNNQQDDYSHHNNQSHRHHPLYHDPQSLPSIQKSVSCPPLPTIATRRPATPPPPNAFAPTPSALPTFVHEPALDSSRTMTPPPRSARTPPPPVRSTTPSRSTDASSPCIPLRQSIESNKPSNKWKARAIANPFAKRKPATQASNNDRPISTPPELQNDQTSVIKPTAVVKKSAFRMQAAVASPFPSTSSVPSDNTTNQDSVANEIAGINLPITSSSSATVYRQPYGKMQHSPTKQLPQQPQQLPRTPPPRPQQRDSPPKGRAAASPPPSPTWDGEMAPKPKAKPVPKAKTKGASSCVGALAEIQRKREERRAMQVQEKQRKYDPHISNILRKPIINCVANHRDDEVKEHGDDTGHKFRRLIKAFRDGMKKPSKSSRTDLFAALSKATGPTLHVGVSFYDIYKNNVCDLLNDRKKIQALEDNEGVVQLVGVSEAAISTDTMLADLVEKVLRAGCPCKSTRMEGAEINKSLLALKECIRAMDVGARHLPFRQSKLTQILRDSFMCDTSRTVMIATVSPCSEHSNHTLNTLRYADRLKEINGRGHDDGITS
ncbi:hypothetical protein DYB25_001931 [Aphanomyces astaci]|uniref:Kinesin motor domain-containing protein n=1 Tax=Aphanomyces astaci TaxID=112090 RepID=A0A397AYN7_APHAT|nr:hypothetical protein DYB36_004154 [Aphanomyces astaci]RHY19358.1 hypothetical protein DYB25_001931 [Aphanomyces astaci]